MEQWTDGARLLDAVGRRDAVSFSDWLCDEPPSDKKIGKLGHDPVHGGTWHRLLLGRTPRDTGEPKRRTRGREFSGYAMKDSVLHAAAGLGDVELISFFMGYGVEAGGAAMTLK